MGKRSEFEKIEKDFYRTIDDRAGIMLDRVFEHLDIPEAAYYEPCFGSGDLIENLNNANKYRFHCGGKSDITSGKDALSLTKEDIADCDMIITNPPWSRPLLHDMIHHFKSIGFPDKPVFLLFDMDWASNKSSAPYLPFCRGIYPIGRLRWIPDTKMQSKDNCAWYHFDWQYNTGTEFKNLR